MPDVVKIDPAALDRLTEEQILSFKQGFSPDTRFELSGSQQPTLSPQGEGTVLAPDAFQQLTSEQLADFATQTKWSPYTHVQSNPGLEQDNAAVEKLAQTDLLLRKRGFKLKDIDWGSVAKAPISLLSGLVSYGGKLVTAAASPVAEVVSRATGFAEPGAMIQAGTKAMGEAIAATELGATSTIDLARRGLEKTGRLVHLEKPLNQYTPGDAVTLFRRELGVRNQLAEIAKGKGALTEDIGGQAVKEAQIDPEEVAKTAAGDPLTFMAFGGAFRVINAATGKILATAATRVAALQTITKLNALRGTQATAEKLAAGIPSAENLAAANQAAIDYYATREAAGVLPRAGEALVRAAERAGETIKAGLLPTAIGRGTEVVGAGLEKAAPLTGVAVAAHGVATGRPWQALALLGGRGVRGIAAPVVEKAGQALERAGGGLAAGEAAGWTRAWQDLLNLPVNVTKGAMRGLPMDLGLAWLTAETPEETRETPLMMTAFGGLHGAARAAGGFVRGQTIAPRPWAPSTSWSRAYGNFPEFDAAHRATMQVASPGVKERIGALRDLADTAGSEIYQFSGPADMAQALQRAGYTPADATNMAESNAVALGQIPDANGVQRKVIFLRDPAAAPHEVGHPLENIFTQDQQNLLYDQIEKSYGVNGLIQRAYREANALAVTPEAKQEVAVDWIKFLLRTTGFGKSVESPTPEQALELVKKYAAKEIAADTIGTVINHATPKMLDDTTFLGTAARVLAKAMISVGQDPYAGVTAQGPFATPIKMPVAETVRELVTPFGREAGKQPVSVAPTVASKAPAVPTTPDVAAQKAKDWVEKNPTGEADRDQAVTGLADALTAGQGIRVLYWGAKGDPAGEVTSIRPERRAEIEAQRGAENKDRVLMEKEIFPYRVDVRANGPQFVGWSPDNFDANIGKFSEWLGRAIRANRSLEAEILAQVPYELDVQMGRFTAKGRNELLADAQRLMENQRAGLTGAGGELVVPAEVEARGFTQPEKAGVGVVMDQNRADIINYLFNIQIPETVTRVAPLHLAGQEISAATLPGRLVEPVRPRGEYAPEKLEKAGIPGPRRVLEVNPFRQWVEQTAVDAKVARPSLVEVSQRLNVARIEKTVPSLRPEYFGGNVLTLAAGFQPSSNPQAIATAAVRDKNSGRIWTGQWHGEALLNALYDASRRALVDKGIPRSDELEYHEQLTTAYDLLSSKAADNFEDGFVDNAGNFLNRKESYKRAVDIGQIAPGQYSESAGFSTLRPSLETDAFAKARQFQARTEFAKDIENRGFEFRWLNYLGTGDYRLELYREGVWVGGIYATAADKNTAHVGLVSVSPRYRGQGLGEGLYRELATQLRDAGFSELIGEIIAPEPLDIREKVFGPGRTQIEAVRENRMVPLEEAKEIIRQGRKGFESFLVEATSRIEPGAQFQAGETEARRVAEMTPDEFTKWGQEAAKTRGGYTGIAMETGRAATSQEFVDFLKAQQLKAHDAYQNAMTAKDYSLAMAEANREQFFRETYEAATGTGSVGFVLRKQEPGYKAPFAQAQPPLSAEPEAIKEAAVRHRITGKIYTDKTHYGAREKLIKDEPSDVRLAPPRNIEYGFVTRAGEFLNRRDAYKRAQEYGQLPEAYDFQTLGGGLESVMFDRMRQAQPGFLGNINEDGNVVARRTEDLSVATHEKLGLSAADVQPSWRYNDKTKTVYWWNLMDRLPEDRAAVKEYLEKRGYKVEQEKGIGIDYPERSYRAAHQAQPRQTYREASQDEGNPWVKPPGVTDHSNRLLMVQFSTDLINKNAVKDEAVQYYDKLYSGAREGYARLQDFWEIPQWTGFLSKFAPDADFYVVRDMAEAKRFLNESGYGRVAFSALDVNAKLIKELAEGYKGAFDVGGYAAPSEFKGVSNIKWHDSMESLAKDMGVPYVQGVDYRHFAGSDVIPRLTMSQGCKHKCAFCTVEKTLKETPQVVIEQQADEIGKLGAKLVYLNDKTFGQAPNYKTLPDIFERIKAVNPDFKGFIIQTTASQMRSFSPEWLARSGIKFVELGIETYNDPILKAMHKPATESLMDRAVAGLREAKIALIPNILIGLPGETAETYARTLDFLKRNKDIISHANIYNLAVYKEAELGKKLTTASDGDFDENVLEKSWMTNPEIHRQFAGDLYGMGSEMLGTKPPSAQMQPTPGENRRAYDERIARENAEAARQRAFKIYWGQVAGVEKEGKYDNQISAEQMRQMGAKSFDVGVGPSYHDPQTWVQLREDIKGKYPITDEALKQAAEDAIKEENTLWEMSREFQASEKPVEKIDDMTELWTPGIVTPEGTRRPVTGEKPVLYVIRHGSTDFNNEADPTKDRIRGHLNIPLNEAGREEAKNTAESLRGSNITRLYTSNLDRSKDTANEIAKTTDAEVIEDARLRPWNLGPEIEGHPVSEVQDQIDYFFKHPDEAPKGGESFNVFKGRFLAAYKQIQRDNPDDNAGIVTHYRNLRLLEAWQKAGATGNKIDQADILEQRQEPPAGFHVVDKNHQMVEGPTAQAQARKSEDRFSPGVAGAGFKKAWILPDGSIRQLGGMFHADWLEQNQKEIKPWMAKPPSAEEDARVAALRAGFARVNYSVNDGTLTVEARVADWAKLRDAYQRLAEANLDDIDTATTNLYNRDVTKLQDTETVKLFRIKNAADKLAALPFMSETPRETGFHPIVEAPPLPTVAFPGQEEQARAIRFANIAKGIPTETQAQSRFLAREFKDELKKIRSGLSGGQTFNPDGSVWAAPTEPSDLVSLASVNVPQGELTPERVVKALGPYADLLDEPGIAAGMFSFSQDGKPTVSIDVNLVVPQKYRKNTMAFAKNNDQVAIWDAAKGEEVRTGGGGNTKLKTLGELSDVIPNLRKGKVVDVEEIIRQNREAEPVAETGELFSSKRALSSVEISSMTKADLARHFPEAVIPGRRNEPIPSEITKSPLYKTAATEQEAIAAFARRLVEFAKEYQDRPEFKSGEKWYSEFVPALKKTFGKDSKIMAELLAATSPQNPPDTNFAYALDALEGFKSGRFDKIIDKYGEGLTKLNDGSWRKWYDKELKADRIPEPPAEPTEAAFLEHWNFTYKLNPKQSNGKNFGISSPAVLQVLARVWLEKTGGLKTQNFVRNLLGIGHEATIDLWADRTMRRLGYRGFKERWRILTQNATGVSDADFKFAQAVFRAAAEEMGMKPDALQAAVWFAEKDLWGREGWSRLNLGDFRVEIKKTELLRAGIKERLRQAKAKEKTGKMETGELPLVEPL